MMKLLQKSNRTHADAKSLWKIQDIRFLKWIVNTTIIFVRHNIIFEKYTPYYLPLIFLCCNPAEIQMHMYRSSWS